MLRTVTWLFILVLFYSSPTTTSTTTILDGVVVDGPKDHFYGWDYYDRYIRIFWVYSGEGEVRARFNYYRLSIHISLYYVQPQQLMDGVLGASRVAEKETQPCI